MDDSLYFSEQHLAVREMVRAFARDEVAPIAAKYDASAEFPWESVRKMADLGLLGVPWAVELGGSGHDLLSYITVIHELAWWFRNIDEPSSTEIAQNGSYVSWQE